MVRYTVLAVVVCVLALVLGAVVCMVLAGVLVLAVLGCLVAGVYLLGCAGVVYGVFLARCANAVYEAWQGSPVQEHAGECVVEYPHAIPVYPEAIPVYPCATLADVTVVDGATVQGDEGGMVYSPVACQGNVVVGWDVDGVAQMVVVPSVVDPVLAQMAAEDAENARMVSRAVEQEAGEVVCQTAACGPVVGEGEYSTMKVPALRALVKSRGLATATSRLTRPQCLALLA
jgi:hypothetical protein